MAKQSNVIVINGRRYDAATGDLLAEQAPRKAKAKPSIDGFAKPTKKTVAPAATGKILTPKQVKKEVRKRAKRAQELHRKTTKSKTLVRSSTSKPSKRSSFRSKIVTSATAFASGASGSATNDLAETVSATRLKHAKASKQSASISRYSDSITNSKAVNNHHVSSVDKFPSVSKKNQLIAEQMAKASTSPNSNKRTQKNPFSKTADYVKKSPKITTIVATSLAALMLFGYITYLNVPNMALRVAAVKAGFAANMPGYSPNGYRFTGPVAYSPGQITVQFQSNTDDREYSITQRQTNWDSKSLLDNFVKKEVNTDYSTIYDRGLTVYIYNGSNAAWVNGGIWYTVSGDALLGSEHLMRIAASL